MSFLLAGFLGGVLRGIMGLVKYSTSYKDVEVRPYYFGGTIVLSGLIGFVAAFIVNDLGISFLGLESLPISIAIVIGYAGGDFLENIFKIIIKNPDLYKIGKNNEEK